MKQKLLKLTLLLCALITGGSTWAETESVTFSEQGYENQQTIPNYNGSAFSITFNKGTNSSAPKYYTSGTAIRIYGGGYFTINSENTITEISLTFGSGDSSNAITTDVGEYSDGTWTGSANSITFTIGGTSGHRRLAGVSVTYTTGGDTPDLEENDLALTGAPIALSFDLYNNANAQVISYTTSSTGEVSVKAGEYDVSCSVDETNKTITVTPIAVTDGEQTVTVNQAADETYKAGSVTFTVTVTDSTPVVTHTATFSVNGATTSQEYQVGADIEFPADPADVSGKTFVGWVAAAIDGTTDEAPEFVTSAQMGDSDVTFYAVFAYASGELSEVTDVLDRELTGVTGNIYTEWSGVTSNSDAVYAGQSAGGNDAIQLRSNNSNSGIVTTTSGGKAKKVVVTWNSNTADGRAIQIYGSNKAYASISNLFNDTYGHDKIGEIVKGTSTELAITGDCEHIGIRSESGALYLDEIQITWQTGDGVTYSEYCTTVVAAAVERPVIEVAENPFRVSTTATITCATEGAAIQYSFDGETWNAYTEALTITETTTIYAKATKGDDESAVAQVTATKIKAEASIAVSPTTVDAAAEGAEGTIEVSYNNITEIVAEVQFCDAEGAAATYDWIVAEINSETNNVDYIIDENTSTEARTAYIKVYALDDEGEDVYSELITITQEGATATPATTSGKKWVLTDLTNLKEGDVFVIVGNNGETFAMSNDNGTSSAPAAVAVTVVGNTLSGDIAENIQWSISGNATDGYTFHPNGDEEAWLYCTNSNNGVRVGTNDNKTFTLDESGYLKHTGTDRYIGIYNSQDWRCYTNTAGNIKDQTFAFYKRADVVLNAYGFATFASTEALDFSDFETAGYKAWQATSTDGGTIQFEQIKTTVAAGTGILLSSDDAGAAIELKVATEGEELQGNLLKGFTEAAEVASGEYFGLSGDEFVKVTAGTIPAGRALLPVSAVGSDVKSLIFTLDGNATGINSLTPALSEGEGAIYNVAGQRLQKLQKGINIVNGKKVLY